MRVLIIELDDDHNRLLEILSKYADKEKVHLYLNNQFLGLRLSAVAETGVNLVPVSEFEFIHKTHDLIVNELFDFYHKLNISFHYILFISTVLKAVMYDGGDFDDERLEGYNVISLPLMNQIKKAEE